MQIDFANLKIQHNLYKEEIEEAILKVARDCNFIMGSQIDELERNLEKFTGSKYAISCSSGTDALLLASFQKPLQTPLPLHYFHLIFVMLSKLHKPLKPIHYLLFFCK